MEEITSLESTDQFTSVPAVTTGGKHCIHSPNNGGVQFDERSIQATFELWDNETEAVNVLASLRDKGGVVKVDKKLSKKRRKLNKKLKLSGSTIISFQNDEEMPYFYKDNSKGMTSLDVVNILLARHSTSRTCTKRPFGCKENAVFLVKLSRKCLFEDITYDDMTWKSSGRRTSGLVLTRNSQSSKCVKILPRNDKANFSLIRIYRKNSSNKNFRCIISYVKVGEEIFNSLVLIQYYFIGSPSNFTIKPHGNSNSVASFQPTKPSTKRLLKELLQVKRPSEAVRQARLIIGEGAGMTKAICDLPLGKQQAYDMNRRKRKKQVDKSTE